MGDQLVNGTTLDDGAPHTIVLIHGLWMTPLCWEDWIDRFTARAFRVLAPSWPGMGIGEAQLRRNPSAIARLGVQEIVDHYDRIIRQLERPPIIMGHSLGGAFVQLLLDRGLGAAGVAIHSAGVRGVRRLPFSTIRSAWPILRNLGNMGRAVPLTPRQFHYAFTNTLTERASAKVYARYHVPGSGRVFFQWALANLGSRSVFRVDFRRDDRAPLLFIAGGDDHLMPASVNEANASKYAESRTVTAYTEFRGRSHFTLGQAGWERVADYALQWAIDNTGSASRRAHDADAASPVAAAVQ